MMKMMIGAEKNVTHILKIVKPAQGGLNKMAEHTEFESVVSAVTGQRIRPAMLMFH